MVSFQTKIQIWVNFGGPSNEKSWYILWLFGIYCDFLVPIFYGDFGFWFISLLFGILIKKNLAALNV
jgi:hypothetical protein